MTSRGSGSTPPRPPGATATRNAWQRVRVRYDNGLSITANQLEEPLTVGGHVLDRFGWLAEGAGVTAWTASRDGIIADYAETTDRVFANARPASDWNLSGIKRIRPVITALRSRRTT